MIEPLFDTYGFRVRNRFRRHWKCKCKVPCQGRFRCTSRRHRGHRSTPWCNGAADPHPNFCDHCANAAEAMRAA